MKIVEEKYLQEPLTACKNHISTRQPGIRAFSGPAWTLFFILVSHTCQHTPLNSELTGTLAFSKQVLPVAPGARHPERPPALLVEFYTHLLPALQGQLPCHLIHEVLGGPRPLWDPRHFHSMSSLDQVSGGLAFIPLYHNPPVCFVGGIAHNRVWSVWKPTLVLALGFLVLAVPLFWQEIYSSVNTNAKEADVSQELAPCQALSHTFVMYHVL